jgi:hypothetical protein
MAAYRGVQMAAPGPRALRRNRACPRAVPVFRPASADPPERPPLDGRVYIGAVTVAALFAGYIGPRFEPRSIQIEQYFQAGLWLLTTAAALTFILRRNIQAHKIWMMRSYGFCLVFVLSRVPDAVPGFHWTDQMLADVLWGLIILALVGPDLILAARTLARRR